MKHHLAQQGSAMWHQLRLGMPTASELDQILTPAKLEPSKSARAYAFRLAAEKLLGRPLTSDVQSKWMERGNELEPDAVKLWEFQEDAKAEVCGFCTTDDGRIGASPDRFVGSDGLLEIKAPAPHTHLCYLVDGFGPAYLIQAQGQLLVTEREWCARVSYHPEMPLVVDRQYRDEAVIAKLRDTLDVFLADLDRIVEKARSLGVIEAARVVLTPEELADQERGPNAPFLHTIINPWSHQGDTNLMAG